MGFTGMDAVKLLVGVVVFAVIVFCMVVLFDDKPDAQMVTIWASVGLVVGAAFAHNVLHSDDWPKWPFIPREAASGESDPSDPFDPDYDEEPGF